MANNYSPLISQSASQYGVPLNLLAAQLQQESNYNPNAVSLAGAQGIAQFMPATAKQYGINPFDPNQAIPAMAQMDSQLLQKYNGDIPSALAGYNWGQGNVDRKGLQNAPVETQNYINSIQNKMGTQYAQNIDPSKLSDADLDMHIAQLQSQQVDPSKLSDADLDAQIAKLQGSNPGMGGIPAMQAPAPQDLILNQNGYAPSAWDKYGQPIIDANSNMYKAFGAGLGQMTSGLGQIISKNIGDVDPITGGSIGQDAANMGAVSNQMQNQVVVQNPILATLANMAPKIAAVAPLGVSVPAIVGGGAALGATSPTITSDQQQQAPINNPQSTMLDRFIQPVGQFNQNLISNFIDPESTIGKAAQGALGAGETVGAAKLLGKGIGAVKNSGLLQDESSGGNPPPPPAASIEDVAKLKNAAYQKADASGQVFSPDDLANKFASDVKQAIPKPLSNGQLSEGDSYLNKILQTYTGFEDKPLGISEVDKIDKNLTGDITRAYKAGYNHEAGILRNIQDNFRMQTINAPAGADLAQARGLAAAEFKMRDLQTIKETANTQGEIKTGLKNLYKRIQKNPSGWTNDEIAAVKDGSTTGILTGALNTVGSKLISGVAGGIGGGLGGGIPGALAGAAVGEGIGFPLRQAAKMIQSRKLNNAMNTIVQRPVVQNALLKAGTK